MHGLFPAYINYSHAEVLVQWVSAEHKYVLESKDTLKSETRGTLGYVHSRLERNKMTSQRSLICPEV